VCHKYRIGQGQVCSWSTISTIQTSHSTFVVRIGGGSLLVLMIETPSLVQTHSRSSLYIYSVSAPSAVASGHKS